MMSAGAARLSTVRIVSNLYLWQIQLVSAANTDCIHGKYRLYQTQIQMGGEAYISAIVGAERRFRPQQRNKNHTCQGDTSFFRCRSLFQR